MKGETYATGDWEKKNINLLQRRRTKKWIFSGVNNEIDKVIIGETTKKPAAANERL